MPVTVCRLVVLCAYLLALFPAAAAAEPAPAWGQAWHLSLQGSIQQRADLAEHYQFTPTAARLPGVPSGWERKWNEQRAGVTLGYDLMASEHWLLQPRAGVGMSQAWFSAANNPLGFSETWRSRPGLMWSVGAAAEARAGPQAGPFLRLGYDWRAAGMKEESESIITQGPGGGAGNRDAAFRWQEQEISLMAGWRLGAWTPRLGVALIDWRLQKSLAYHIPESEARTPPELDLIRLLNSRKSQYQYHNGRAWAPRLGLGWSPLPGWSLELDCRLAADPEIGLGLTVSF